MVNKCNRIEMFRDSSGLWRWQVRAGKNRTVAASEQGYRNYYYALFKAKISAGFGADVKILEPHSPTPVPVEPPLPDESSVEENGVS